MIWQPDEPGAAINAEELINALLTDEKVRAYCGILDNGDNTYWVKDLERVKAQQDETKTILRDFLKRYGRRPEPTTILAPSTIDAVVGKHAISPELRMKLDRLYSRIDELIAKAPKQKF